jgi:hypothetical protein
MKYPLFGAVLAASALALSAPLAAQGFDKDAFWTGAPAGIGERVDFLQARIDRGVAHHHLNRIEGTRAQSELGRIRQITGDLRTRDGGQLSEADRTYVQDRLDQLSSTIHWMAHNNW